jgi:hypothetical protein
MTDQALRGRLLVGGPRPEPAGDCLLAARRAVAAGDARPWQPDAVSMLGDRLVCFTDMVDVGRCGHLACGSAGDRLRQKGWGDCHHAGRAIGRPGHARRLPTGARPGTR